MDSVGVLMCGVWGCQEEGRESAWHFQDSLLLMLALAVPSLQKVDHIEIWALATLTGLGGEE